MGSPLTEDSMEKLDSQFLSGNIEVINMISHTLPDLVKSVNQDKRLILVPILTLLIEKHPDSQMRIEYVRKLLLLKQ